MIELHKMYLILSVDNTESSPLNFDWNNEEEPYPTRLPQTTQMGLRCTPTGGLHQRKQRLWTLPRLLLIIEPHYCLLLPVITLSTYN